MNKRHPSFAVLDDYQERPGDPERLLLMEVICRAINDAIGHYRNGGNTSYYDKIEARRWIFEREETNQPFGFGWCCEHLNIEPRRLRLQIERLMALSIEEGDEALEGHKQDWLWYLKTKLAKSNGVVKQ